MLLSNVNNNKENNDRLLSPGDPKFLEMDIIILRMRK